MTDERLIDLWARQRLGVSLTDEEVSGIAQMLERMRASLEAMRPGPAWTAEPHDIVRVLEASRESQDDD